jgi:opacity protein-like surface antigen
VLVFRPVRHALLVLALLSPALAAPSGAADAAAPAPVNYVAGFLGTTLGYRPPGGEWDGWQHDFTSQLGYGRQVTPTLALELDLGPTYVRGRYTSFALTPGLVWSFHPNVYAAARFAVPVDPELNLVLLPGIGVCRPFGRVMPTLELNFASAVGRGDPDFGVTLTAGLLVFF